LRDGGEPEEGVRLLERLDGRLQELAHGRPELLREIQEFRLTLETSSVEAALLRADRHFQAKEQAAGLAEARNAARSLEACFRHESLTGTLRRHTVHLATKVSKRLRDSGEPGEAVRLLEHVNDQLQKLAREVPKEDLPGVLVLQSEAWFHLGKVRWLTDQEEETLVAFRHAVEMQRQACDLASASVEYRRVLGDRYHRLARKLCELGRLDEAEECYRQRQALWPNDAAWREVVLRDLRKWANEVGDGQKPLTPQERLERQRYLDLRARLERTRGGAAVTTDTTRP
jgi:tetratricopeptide (TPR) repeat protein